MKTKVIRLIVFLVLIVVVIILAACSAGTGNQIKVPTTNLSNPDLTTAPSSKVSPTWVTPELADFMVVVPLDVVQNKINTHFEVALEIGKAYFMAYAYGGKTYVRADICPPCRSISYSLIKDSLVCDSCGTSFKAVDGTGIKGACVNYPKASVPYETVDGKILMNKADLTIAYQNTLGLGSP